MKEKTKNIVIIILVLAFAVTLFIKSKDDTKNTVIDTSDIVSYKVEYYLQNSETNQYELLTSKVHNGYIGTEITIVPDEFDNYSYNEEQSTNPLTAVLSKEENICFELYYSYTGE